MPPLSPLAKAPNSASAGATHQTSMEAQTPKWL